jgi:hypothetical protein
MPKTRKFGRENDGSSAMNSNARTDYKDNLHYDLTEDFRFYAYLAELIHSFLLSFHHEFSNCISGI